MNRTYKVIFNKARGVLMVANEITSSVQKKGTKTVVATAVASLMASGAMAAAWVDAPTSPSATEVVLTYSSNHSSTNKYFAHAKTGEDLAAGESVWVSASGSYNYLTGVYSNASGAVTNNGKIYITSSGNASPWSQKGMMAQGEGQAINDGTIVAKSAYGMTTQADGATTAVKVVNNGEIAVLDTGIGMELNGGSGVNNGTINVGKLSDTGTFVIGVQIDGEKASNFTNNGSIITSSWEKDINLAIAVTANATGDNQITLVNGSTTIGDIAIQGKANLTIEKGANYDGEIMILNSQASSNIVVNLANKEVEDSGAAVLNHGAMKITDSTFTNNKATYGGAVYNTSVGGDMTISNSKFVGNVATQVGGAIATGTSAKGLALEGVEFTSNRSEGDGGAVGVYSSVTIANSLFEGNTAQFDAAGNARTDDDTAIGGGAISFGSKAAAKISSISSTKFVNNRSGYHGGAIGTRLAEDGSVELATLDIEATFEGNEAVKSGGAFYNSFHNVKLSGVFTNNVAGEEGGAFYNSGNNVEISEATFSGNTAEGKLNDIYNAGSITVQKSLTLDGGVTGPGTLTFADGSTLTVKAGTTTIANSITNNGAKLNMTFAAGYAGGEYQLVTGTLNNEFTLDANNALFTVTTTDTLGTYNVVAKSAEQIAEGLTQTTSATSNEAAAAAAMAGASAEGTNETFENLSNSIVEGLQSTDPAAQQAAVEALAAVNPEVAPVVVETATSTGTAVMGAIGNHLSGTGAASGDMFEESALWVQAMDGKTDMEDTSKAKGYDADSYGIAVGTEAKLNADLRVGAGLAYTTTDIDAENRATEVDTHTAFVYGEWKAASECYVNGMISYSWGDYEEQAGAMGESWKSEYDVDTFGMQIMTGHNMHIQGATLTPEVGVRYFHIRQGEYTNGLGTNVSATSNNVFTGVVGAKLSKAFEVGSTVVKPEARVAMTYDFVDADNDSFVTLANGASYNVEGETLDKFGVEVGVGVMAEVNDNLEFSFVYDGAFRGDYKNHSALINAKYKF